MVLIYSDIQIQTYIYFRLYFMQYKSDLKVLKWNICLLLLTVSLFYLKQSPGTVLDSLWGVKDYRIYSMALALKEFCAKIYLYVNLCLV